MLGFLDADGTCDPRFFATLCETAAREQADVVLGCRLNPDSRMPPIRRVGNLIFAAILSVLSSNRVGAYADPKVEFIRRHVPLSGRVLDVGWGNGIFTLRLARDGATVIGIDTSPHLLSMNPHPWLVCGDATSLPFPDSSFDVVFEANVLHHVERRDTVVQEMARVSRRYVVLLEPNRYNPLMFGFSLVVPAERGCLKSSITRLKSEASSAGLRVLETLSTGMISQNNTPSFLVPLLKRFDRPIAWGEYLILIAEH